MEFLDIPSSYYNELKKRLALSKVQVKEDFEKLQKLKILILSTSGKNQLKSLAGEGMGGGARESLGDDS